MKSIIDYILKEDKIDLVPTYLTRDDLFFRYREVKYPNRFHFHIPPDFWCKESLVIFRDNDGHEIILKDKYKK